MCSRAQVLEVLHCHQKAPVPVLRDGPVMSRQIVSVEAAACGHPLSGDIPYLLWLCDVLAVEAFNTSILYDMRPYKLTICRYACTQWKNVTNQRLIYTFTIYLIK